MSEPKFKIGDVIVPVNGMVRVDEIVSIDKEYYVIRAIANGKEYPIEIHIIDEQARKLTKLELALK
jgi:hypothetical protein